MSVELNGIQGSSSLASNLTSLGAPEINQQANSIHPRTSNNVSSFKATLENVSALKLSRVGEVAGSSFRLPSQAQEVKIDAGNNGTGVGAKDLINGLMAGDLHKEILSIRGKALEGSAFQPKDLLLYQIKASEFNMRVEMLSKVADSFLGTLKKLQQQP